MASNTMFKLLSFLHLSLCRPIGGRCIGEVWRQVGWWSVDDGGSVAGGH